MKYLNICSIFICPKYFNMLKSSRKKYTHRIMKNGNYFCNGGGKTI